MTEDRLVTYLEQHFVQCAFNFAMRVSCYPSTPAATSIPPHHRWLAVVLSQRAVWPILVPTGPHNGNSGVCKVLGQPGQNTIRWVALDHSSSSWGQAMIGAAADGQQHFSEQEKKPSCSTRPWALCSALVPGARQMSPLFLPQPLPLCNNLESRQELLCCLSPQPG